MVDETFRQQTEDNQERFEAYTTTPRLFLPGGEAPAIGSVFRNPDLARTYRQLGRHGIDVVLPRADRPPDRPARHAPPEEPDHRPAGAGRAT